MLCLLVSGGGILLFVQFAPARTNWTVGTEVLLTVLAAIFTAFLISLIIDTSGWIRLLRSEDAESLFSIFSAPDNDQENTARVIKFLRSLKVASLKNLRKNVTLALAQKSLHSQKIFNSELITACLRDVDKKVLGAHVEENDSFYTCTYNSTGDKRGAWTLDVLTTTTYQNDTNESQPIRVNAAIKSHRFPANPSWASCLVELEHQIDRRDGFVELLEHKVEIPCTKDKVYREWTIKRENRLEEHLEPEDNLEVKADPDTGEKIVLLKAGKSAKFRTKYQYEILEGEPFALSWQNPRKKVTFTLAFNYDKALFTIWSQLTLHGCTSCTQEVSGQCKTCRCSDEGHKYPVINGNEIRIQNWAGSDTRISGEWGREVNKNEEAVAQ